MRRDAVSEIFLTKGSIVKILVIEPSSLVKRELIFSAAADGTTFPTSIPYSKCSCCTN